MSPPRALCLDLDETLLNNHGVHDSAIARTSEAIVATLAGLDGTGLTSAYNQVVETYAAEVEGSWDGGSLDGASFTLEAWRRALRACDCADESVVGRAAQMHERLAREGYRLFDDVHDLLEAARAAGVPLAIITNGPSDTQRTKVAALGIEPWFRTVVISGEVGVAKPETAIFEAALRGLGVEEQGAWHVGDNLGTDVAGANAAGLTSVWLNRRGALRAASHPEPDVEIRSLSELIPLLAGTGAGNG